MSVFKYTASHNYELTNGLGLSYKKDLRIDIFNPSGRFCLLNYEENRTTFFLSKMITDSSPVFRAILESISV